MIGNISPCPIRLKLQRYIMTHYLDCHECVPTLINSLQNAWVTTRCRSSVDPLASDPTSCQHHGHGSFSMYTPSVEKNEILFPNDSNDFKINHTFIKTINIYNKYH